MPTPIINPPNSRVFYACQAVLYKERQTTTTGGNDVPTSNAFLTGVQSIGIDSEFPFTPYDDLGRFQKKYGSYGQQLFTINISRVLSNPSTTSDGGTADLGEPFYKVTPSNDYEATHMLANANLGACGLSTGLRNYDITVVYGSDGNEFMDGGLSSGEVFMSTTYRNCILTSISYNFSVGGTVTENITLISKVATQDTQTSGFTNLLGTAKDGEGNNVVIEADTLKGRDIDFASCILPVEVERMFKLGAEADNWQGFDDNILGLQSIELNVDIEYVDLPDIGLWRGSNINNQTAAGDDDTLPTYAVGGQEARRAEVNLFRQVGVPVGVSFSFTGIASAQYRGDIAAIADGSTRQDFELTDTTFTKMDSIETDSQAAVDGVNSTRPYYEANREFRLVAKKGNYGASGWTGANYWQWHLGQKNYLTALSYSGGDAGGGNVEVTLNYQNDHSDFVVFKDTALKTIQTTKTY